MRLSDVRRLTNYDFEPQLPQVTRQQLGHGEAAEMLQNRFQVRVISEIHRESVRVCEGRRAGTNEFPVGGKVALMNTPPKKLVVGDVFAYIWQASSLS